MIYPALLFIALLQSPRSESDFQTLATNSPAIRWIGRFDNSTGLPRCSWPLSTVEVRTNTSQLKVSFQTSSPNDRWQVEIDGKPISVLKLPQGESTQIITTDLPRRNHSVRLVRRTEASAGITAIRSIQTKRESKPWISLNRKRRIEIIGDSISAGFGVDGKNQNEPYSFETANAYLTYGAVASRSLGADCTILAWSGKKLWPDNTLPEIYDRINPQEPQPRWNFSMNQPDAVVINLATNDFGIQNPEKAPWCEAYGAFLRRVRGNYPKARIYMAIGPMMSDSWPPKNRALSTVRDYVQAVLSSYSSSIGKLGIIEFQTQNVERDGSGAAWHPNAKTNQNMAEILILRLKSDLKW